MGSLKVPGFRPYKCKWVCSGLLPQSRGSSLIGKTSKLLTGNDPLLHSTTKTEDRAEAEEATAGEGKQEMDRKWRLLLTPNPDNDLVQTGRKLCPHGAGVTQTSHLCRQRWKYEADMDGNIYIVITKAQPLTGMMVG